MLDGGLATTLEARGIELPSPLWSAQLLIDAPAVIQSVHEDFLRAGADCVTAASYQATIPGFAACGVPTEGARRLLQHSVELACAARTSFWSNPINHAGRLRPLVAASIGPYGAYLADGSEYSGRYDLDEPALIAFHRERWHVLADTAADLLACETIPSGPEARALLHLSHETPGTPIWMSFSCGDDAHLWDGTPITDVADLCAAVPHVVAVGVNCTDPDLVPALVERLRSRVDKPVLAYPNSGERYDARTKRWFEGGSIDFTTAAARWVAAGARLIGGCCRIGPDVIERLRRQLV